MAVYEKHSQKKDSNLEHSYYDLMVLPLLGILLLIGNVLIFVFFLNCIFKEGCCLMAGNVIEWTVYYNWCHKYFILKVTHVLKITAI